MNMRVLSAILTLFLTVDCSRPLVRSAAPEAPPLGPPSIDRLVDLGSLTLPESGDIDEGASDGRFTPGEWMAIMGENLSSTQTIVHIGKTPVEVKGFILGGSLITKVPRGLSTRKMHEVSVETPTGRAAHAIQITSYLIMSDTAMNQVRFWRTPEALDAPVLFEEGTNAVELARPVSHILSPDGGLLYVTGAGSAGYRLTAIHMGAPGGPHERSSLPFSSTGRPTALGISSAKEVLFVLTENELLVFDLENPSLPIAAGRLPLTAGAGTSNARHMSAVVLEKGSTVAVLEAVGGTVTVIDVSNPRAPKPLSSIKVFPDTTMPRAIEMVPDPGNPSGFFLLEGPNLRLTHVGLKQLAEKLFTPDRDNSEDVGGREGSWVHRFDFSSGVLEKTSEYPLPRTFVPLFMCPQADGAVLVSGVGPEIVSLAGIDSISSGIRTAVKALRGAITIGHVIRVDNTGHQEIAKGMSVFLTLDDSAAEKSLVYTAMKVGVRKFPPSIGVELGLHEHWSGGAPRKGVALRTASWKTLIPPYTAPLISRQ